MSLRGEMSANVRGEVSAMEKRTLWIVASGLLLTGCDVFQSARSDFNRLTSSAAPSPPPHARSVAARLPAPPTTGTKAVGVSAAAKPTVKPDAPKEGETAKPVEIVGSNESQLRKMLASPTTVEEHAPGKTWRYRDGQCTYNVQLYPDVQTHEFGTLAYEVKSDDNSDEGNRGCMAQLRSRAQSGG
jgi:hypothetical protein